MLPIVRPSSPVTTNNLVVVLSSVFIWFVVISQDCRSDINYTKHKKCKHPLHFQTQKKMFQRKKPRYMRIENTSKIPSSTIQ